MMSTRNQLAVAVARFGDPGIVTQHVTGRRHYRTSSHHGPEHPHLHPIGKAPVHPGGGTDRRLHVRVLAVDQLRFVTCWAACCRPPHGRLPEHGPDAWRRFGHPQDMETGGCPACGVCAAVDVQYLRTGCARAAAVQAADAGFAHVLAERTAVSTPGTALPAGRVLPARAPAAARGPGRPERAGPAGGRRLRRSGSRQPARPGRACERRVRHPGDRGGQVQVPHRPRGAGLARILGPPPVRHGSWNASRRRGGPGPAHGRPVPPTRRTAPRRHPRAGGPTRSHQDRPPAQLTCADARNAACADVTNAGSARAFMQVLPSCATAAPTCSAIDEFPRTGSGGFISQRAALEIEPLPHPVLVYVAARWTDQASR